VAEKLLRHLTALALLAVVGLSVLEGVRFGWESALWYPQHMLPLLALLWVGRWWRLPQVLIALVGSYALLMPLLAVAVGLGWIDPVATFGWGRSSRMVLYTDNPNLLAADLAAVGFVAALLIRRVPWALWVALAGVAVLLTGSRTAALAVAAGLALWMILPGAALRARLFGILAAALLGLTIFYADSYFAQQRETSNLLHSVSSFGRGWEVQGDAASQRVEANAVRAPQPLFPAHRLTLSGEGDITFSYPLGTSREGMLHQASLWLRAAEPGTLTLNSGLAEVECLLGRRWTLCVTPAVVGDGEREAALSLTNPAGATIDAYGPSYTIEGELLSYRPRNPFGGLLSRFQPERILDVARDRRPDMYELGWRVFLEHPLIGAGRDWIQRVPPEQAVRIDHAHNGLIDIIASAGLLGLALWGALFGSFLRVVFRAFGWRALPWLAVLLALNTTDLTWFHMGPYWSAGILGVVSLQRLRERPPQGA
jgi:hypothetical protein